MKMRFLLSFTIAVSLLASCSKAPVTVTTGGSDSVTVLIQDSTNQSTPGNQTVRVFVYDTTSNKLVKVNYKYNGSSVVGSYDSIYYNGSGYAVKVLSYQIPNPTPTDTTSFYYTGSKLDSTNECGIQNSAPYSVSQIFHYTGSASKPDSLHTATYIAQSGGGGGGPQDIGQIVFSGNNISGAVAYMSGVGAPVVFTVDLTAANPYYGLFFKGSDDVIKMFDANNVETIIAPSIPQTFYSQSYQYSNGRVDKITDTQNSDTTILSYMKIP
jgi:hypothetical protein